MRPSTLADWLWFFAMFSLALAGPAVLAQPPAAGLTADQIVEKYVAARGGREKLAAIQTLMVTGRLHVGAEPGQAITVRLRRPNQLRQDFILQMRTGTRAYDGVTGWERLPSSPTGKSVVQPIDGLALDDIRAEAENGIDGPLVNYREKGHRLELAGIDYFGDIRCYALIVRLKTGQVVRPFIDAETFLQVGERRTRMINGRGMVGIEEHISDHRPVAGVLFPHLFESGPADDPREMRLRIEKIVANPISPAIDETIFRNPVAARP